MLGQTNHNIIRGELQRELRKTAAEAENKLWTHVRAKRLNGYKFRRQHPFGDYILDLVCMERRLIIEVDGSHHLDSLRDRARDASLEAAGFRVLRFWNHDVLARTESVLDAIVLALEDQHHPLPGPPLEGEGEVRCAALSESASEQNHPHPSPPLEGEGEVKCPAMNSLNV